ncbi:hypothetical protein ACHAW5_002168 [Stephanodiscus triporus]|uniref:PNPLA domain-containing protein n=1 Tax=Stephanodiscus triporus TaxID=2934178 RepID=A0ABD3Q529_9STRA
MTALLYHPPAPNVSRRKSSRYNYLPRGKKFRNRSLPSNAIAKHNDDKLSSYSSSSKPQGRVCVAFPGGGLFFYWQAGVIAYLQEEGYNLSSHNTLVSGASAGALSATLAKTGVNTYDATTLALSMSEDAGIWDRPSGLQGVWGSIIRDWLERLLPADAEERAEDGLVILVTPVPSFGKLRISEFEDRHDLVAANMASVHLPWFLDGKLTSNFRGTQCIDGSFLARPSDYFDEKLYYSEGPRLIIDFKRDPVMKDRALEFIKVVSKQTIWDILEQGKKHAKIMDRDGCFRILPRN